MKVPSADPVIGFITKAVDERIAKTAMVPPPIVDPSPEGQNYHAQSVINRTDILTWTSNKGHTNQVSGRDGQSTDSNVAVAGNQVKKGKGKKTAPLAWNFVKSGEEAKSKKQPENLIGPVNPTAVIKSIPGWTERARYVPEDIDPTAAGQLKNIITNHKCDICSKSFMNNVSSRTSHYQSVNHLKKLNNWLKQKKFPLCKLPKK